MRAAKTKKVETTTLTGQPRVIARANHEVSRSDISENALKVLRRLHHAGFAAFLVGGSVRDLLLRLAPKDFDIATDAHPNEIRKLFRNCRLIGRRFRLAHIQFGREIIEVATFRASHDIEHPDREQSHQGMILRDNVFGSLEEDAFRRDFSINALYYNIADFSIVDYTGGFEDLCAGTVRLIGEPELRFQEDPIRMLRAIRFMAKLDFGIDENTERALVACVNTLHSVSSSRLFEEVLKLFHSGKSLKCYELLQKYSLFSQLFPLTQVDITNKDPHIAALLESTFISTDERVIDNKPVTPAFLLAALLWKPMQRQVQIYEAEEQDSLTALENAMTDVILEQLKTMQIPKRLSKVIREIWVLQYRLTRRYGRRPFRLLTHPRFRAGYDFLVIRANAGDAPKSLSAWWTEFQEASEVRQQEMIRKVQREK